MMKKFVLSLLAVVAIAVSTALRPAAAQAPTCNQVLTPGCLYFPAIQYAIGTEPPEVLRETAYKDIGGMLRTVKMAIRIPKDAPGPLPVVIWSHSGASGKRDPTGALVEWSRATARAGYLSISIAHQPRDDVSSRYALCAAAPLSMDTATCDVFKYLNWDRPNDIAAVINELERMNAAGEFRGRIDLARIAVGGHSAGAGGALAVAGALRNFTGTVLDMRDPRPVAFLAFSPQGPRSERFFDTDFNRPQHSWSNIERPVLIGTGDGDSTCDRLPEPGSCFGDSPYIRRISFERMHGGNKYHIYLKDADTFHTLFELHTAECSDPSKNVDQVKCDEIARWLMSTALAFLDAHVRGDALATQWLASDNLVAASAGVAQWLRR